MAIFCLKLLAVFFPNVYPFFSFYGLAMHKPVVAHRFIHRKMFNENFWLLESESKVPYKKTKMMPNKGASKSSFKSKKTGFKGKPQKPGYKGRNQFENKKLPKETAQTRKKRKLMRYDERCHHVVHWMLATQTTQFSAICVTGVRILRLWALVNVS